VVIKAFLIDGMQLLRSGQRRGVTRGLKAMIKRRSAICEPTFGHIKTNGRLDRNPLKGAQQNAVLCEVGLYIRLLMKRLRLIWPEMMDWLRAESAGYGWTVREPILILSCSARTSYI
jgi:IS5 family transposase